MIEVVSPEEAENILGIKKHDNQIVKNEEITNIPLVMVKELPSKFKGYPQGTKISYAPITLGELEAINNGEPDIPRAIAMLLNSIKCNTLNPEDLYYWDVMYIGIQRKLLAFGDTKGVVYGECPVCGNIIEHEFDLTDLEFKECEAEALPLFTKINNKDVEIGLLTIKEFLEMDESKGYLDVYARMIKNINYEEAFELVNNCTGKDSKKLRYIDNQLNYGIKPIMIECDGKITKEINGKLKEENCKEKVRLEVRSPFEVMFPDDQLDGCDEFEIQYGRK